MSGYYYLDVSLILSKQSDTVLPIYFKGSIEQSLRSVFGEIGGNTTVDILKFDRGSCRGILRVPEDFYVKTRAALTLISHFQDIPCYFKSIRKMSLCKEFGKDKVIFVTKEDHAIPSTVEITPPEPQPGLILPSGEINWNCPCLGGMATGPCGVEFRDSFSCFHYSEADPKGSDCYESFKNMQDCFSKYPAVYNKSGSGDGDDDLDLEDLEGLKDTNDSIDRIEEKPNQTDVEKKK